MKKVLIVNAVPTNNGDAALVLGLKEKLVLNGYRVAISTTKYETVKRLYPDVEWVKAEYEFKKIYKRLFRYVPGLKRIILKLRVMLNRTYKELDYIIGAPGGYINSYYGFEDRLYCMHLMKKKSHAKMIIYSQSIGPLNKQDSHILSKYIGDYNYVMARDYYSFDYVKKYHNCIRTNDAAFLLPYDESKKKKGTVAVSVRDWKYDNRDRDIYYELVKKLVEVCIKNGRRVVFISTCQGLDNYIDDSKVARVIYEKLDDEYKTMVMVDSEYHTVYELRDRLKEYEFAVGTRLHMCILSMLAGVPAFNISYEVKGKECFSLMGLGEFSIDYNENNEVAERKLQLFIDELEKLRPKYEKKVKEMQVEADMYFDMVIR